MIPVKNINISSYENNDIDGSNLFDTFSIDKSILKLDTQPVIDISDHAQLFGESPRYIQLSPYSYDASMLNDLVSTSDLILYKNITITKDGAYLIELKLPFNPIYLQQSFWFDNEIIIQTPYVNLQTKDRLHLILNKSVIYKYDYSIKVKESTEVSINILCYKPGLLFISDDVTFIIDILKQHSITVNFKCIPNINLDINGYVLNINVTKNNEINTTRFVNKKYYDTAIIYKSNGDILKVNNTYDINDDNIDFIIAYKDIPAKSRVDIFNPSSELTCINFLKVNIGSYEYYINVSNVETLNNFVTLIGYVMEVI